MAELPARQVEPGQVGSARTAFNENESTVRSPKRLARIAGVLYLLVGIFGGFAEGFVDPKMYVAGNATATAGNVVANSGLVRLGVVAHLLDGTFFVFLAMTLKILLQHVHKSVARAMLVLVALATGIIVLLLLDTQHYGTLIAQVFFGLWLVPLGYLAYISELFPRWLGILLIVGGVPAGVWRADREARQAVTVSPSPARRWR